MNNKLNILSAQKTAGLWFGVAAAFLAMPYGVWHISEISEGALTIMLLEITIPIFSAIIAGWLYGGFLVTELDLNKAKAFSRGIAVGIPGVLLQE